MTNTNPVTINNSRKIKTIDLVTTGMFTALICVLSPFSIPTQPIPFTLAVFTIFLTGAMLTPRFALLSVLTYLLIGVCGVPVFSGFGSGPQKLFGPTGGFLMAFPLMALIIALFNKYFKKHKGLVLISGMLVSLVLCYLLGTLWFLHLFPSKYSFYSALLLCVIPYIPFDLIKLAIAVSFALVLRKTLMKNSIQ